MKFYMVFAVFFYCSSIFPQSIDSTICGKWESIFRSPDGFGTTLIINHDNTAQFIKVLMKDYVYSLQGNKLFKAYFYENKQYLDSSEISIKKDTLIERNNINGTISTRLFVRVGHQLDSLNVLLGKWRWRNSANQDMFYEFKADRLLYMRLPVKTWNGTYQIDGKHIVLKFEGMPKWEMNFQFVMNSLVLTDAKKNELSFKRVDR